MQNKQNDTSFQETKPLVSFIVTYYNLPIQMLCKCIDSILALSLRCSEREIIIVDDGSELSPMNGLIQYSNDITYVRQKHGGVSTARNTGIKMAQGTYIQFVDGDDYLLQSAFEHCLDIIRMSKDIDMVMFDFTSYADNKSVFHDQPICSGTEYMLKNNIHGSSWSYLFRRQALGELRFVPGIANGEDEEFTAQLMLRVENIVVTDAKAYYYRQRKESAVHNQDASSKQKRLEDTVNVIRHLNMISDRLPTTDKLAMQRRVAQLTMDYIYNTIVLTHSKEELDKRLAELHAEGLFPLPDREYSKKYIWFRKMTNSAFGRSVLLHTLPFIKKER